MTEDDFVAQMETRLLGLEGPEEDHRLADQILLEALRHLGWERLADTWEQGSKNWWWA